MMFAGFALLLLSSQIIFGYSRRRLALLVERAQLSFTLIAEDLQRTILQGDLHGHNRAQAILLLERVSESASNGFFQAINLWTLLAVAAQHRGDKAGLTPYPPTPTELQPFNDRCNMVLASFIRARHPLVATAVLVAFSLAASPREALRWNPFQHFWDINLLAA